MRRGFVSMRRGNLTVVYAHTSTHIFYTNIIINAVKDFSDFFMSKIETTLTELEEMNKKSSFILCDTTSPKSHMPNLTHFLFWLKIK